MNSVHQQFYAESKVIMLQMKELIRCSQSLDQAKNLAEVSQLIDRIMGGARSVAEIEGDRSGQLISIADYSEFCKKISLKASRLIKNDSLYRLVIEFMLDSCKSVDWQLNNPEDQSQIFNPRVKERAQDILNCIDKELNIKDPPDPISQSEIDELIQKLSRK